MQLPSLRTSVVYISLLLASLAIFLLYIVGVARYIADHDENTCDMTYMFEYPQYVRIGLSPNSDDANEDYLYPRFRLYAYGEGFVTERLRRMYFSGIPVLFIPGNAGSHEQVRSLASVSLRKSLKSRSPFHFDYFSISFGKDYSAFYGGILKEETVYTAKCIKRILSLYQGRVKQIILIGHSMGGIVAEGALLTVPEINSDVASILITLATPHKPSFYPDFSFYNYYREISNLMDFLKKNGTSIISIGGGPRDIVVPSFQTINKYADLNVLSTSIPGVWRSTDHLCILWCKQLIMNVIRSLFDCVDTSQKPPEITANLDHRTRVFKWHFLQRYNKYKQLPQKNYIEKIDFPKEESQWIEKLQNQYVWSSKQHMEESKKSTTVYLMYRLIGNIDTLSVDAINLKSSNWIYACSPTEIHGHSRVCSEAWNLSNYTQVLPGLTRKPWKYSVDLDLNQVRAIGASHVIIRVPAQTLKSNDDDKSDDDDDDNQLIYIDAYQRSTRYKRVTNMKPWTSERGYLRYNIILDSITDALTVELKNSNCHGNTSLRYSMVELIEPGMPGAGQMYFFGENENAPKTLKMQTMHASRLRLMKSQSAELKLFLHPECSYDIHLHRANVIEQISCMVRDRWTSLYPVIIGLLLLSISQRIDCRDDDKTRITAIIVIVMILTFSLNLIVECLVGIAILHIMAVGVCCSVVFFGSVAHNIAVRFLARAITFSATWSDWLLGGIVNQLPIVAAGILLSMIPATCGALAMLLSLFLHFLRLTSMYEDYLEELLLASMRHFNLLRKKDKNDGESSDSIRQNILNQVMLFLFWCFAALPAIPSALVWAKNFSFSTRLITEDQIFLYSWIVMVACGTSGLVKIPTTPINSYKTKSLATLLNCLGWIAMAIPSTNNAAYFYLCFPPSLAVVTVLISLNALQT